MEIQRKILVAYENNNMRKVKVLQCCAARIMAVRQVVSNSGGFTPGMDDKLIRNMEELKYICR